MPRKGPVEVSGMVTNTDDETWNRINLYSFLEDTPIDDVAQLQQATAVGEDVPVGDRITVPGTEARVDSLEPGESTPFALTVPSQVLLARLSEQTGRPVPGVYWFGVHALGESSAGRDELTDGRARTFLPLLPEDPGARVRTSIVVPLRAPVLHQADGSLSDLQGWTDRLSLGGPLRDRLDFGGASGRAPVSWLVDPAVVDAAGLLADGNLPRSLAPTPQTPTPSESTAPPSGPTGSPESSAGVSAPGDGATASPDGSTTPGEVPATPLAPEAAAAARAAQTWLDRVASLAGRDEVLELPYGDLDVAGALATDPAVYDAARRLTSPVLRRLEAMAGTSQSAVVAPPSGFVDPATLGDVSAEALVLGSDEMVGGSPPSVARIDGRAVVLASTGAAAGGPGPEDPLSTLALRQRILSEAALRLLDAGVDGPDSLVVVMPRGWAAESGSTFFGGLRTPGVRLTTLTRAVAGAEKGMPGSTDPGVEIDPVAVVYPARQARRALGEQLFDGLATLRQSAATLQSVLLSNDEISGVLDAEAYSAASYAARRNRSAARVSLRASRDWVRDLLGRVTISGPPGVTLSGARGSFSATLVNGLDEPVVVQVEGVSDDGITVPVSAPVELDAQGRATVLLQAEDVEPGVHNVALRVLDGEGRPLPGSDAVPIRSAQVSNVIWVIMGAGLLLIFGTIALRAVRRVRAHRVRS